MSRSRSAFRALAIVGMLLLGGLTLFPSPAAAAGWVKNDMGIPYNGSVSSGLYGVAVGDGNRDGQNELYVNAYDNAHVYQYNYANKSWNIKDLGVLGRGNYGNAVQVGDADDDGKLDVYATALASSSYNVYVYQIVKTDNGWTRTEMGVGGYYR